MNYILDTNILSFLMEEDQVVSERLLARSRASVLVPQPVFGEIEYGLARLPSSRRKHRLRRQFELLREELSHAEWTDDVSRVFGEIKADLERRGLRLEDFDVAIAAHALASKAVLVTDNISHMERIRGLELENWRQPPPS